MDLHALITIVLAVLAWFILIRWVLPWFGVPTCMGGCCCASQPAAGRQVDSSKDSAQSSPTMQACCPDNRDNPKPIHTDVSK